MKTLSDYMHQASRADGSTLWKIERVNGAATNKDLENLIMELHGMVFPTDYVFEVVADCIGCALGYDSSDAAKEDEMPLPVYDSEIRQGFTSLGKILDETFDEWKDYAGELQTDPLTFQTNALYGYITWAYNRVIDFLESENAWSDKNEKEQTESANK